MRHFRTLILLLTSLLTFTMASAEEHRYDAGVSRELAQWRKATIKDVVYTLHFDLIEDRAKTTISFNLAAPQEVVIDLRNTDLVSDVLYGGESILSQCTLANEHIVVPANITNEGSNAIVIKFAVDNQSLNRKPDFLYTLLVPDRARTLFPCFDQPDMKAEYNLSLTLPEGWVAVSNTAVSKVDGNAVTFAPTEPLSTYLFSFVAGKFDSRTYDDGNHRFTAYYRETDPKRLAQLDTIFEQVAASLEWLEEYTGIPYPFAKYDLIMLPGFQYGGMEHTGATLYNDTQMFLGENPTLDEELRRIQLIAHETAHMWFGDYVTMEWFNDVWTKEIFANYFAARMTEPLFPDVNHRLNRLKTYTHAAYNEDRTAGRSSIRQDLDNLNNAGLIYGQTIYNKAPIVMDKIVELMGEEAFREGIQEYLRTYAYGNATWNDLVAILDKHSEEDIETFSFFWVEMPYMPIIQLTKESGRYHIFTDSPLWQQRFNCYVVYKNGKTEIVEVEIKPDEGMPLQEVCDIKFPRNAEVVIPNCDGRGYGLFILPNKTIKWMMEHIGEVEDDLMRQSMVTMLNEVYEWRNGVTECDARAWLDFLLNYIPCEKSYLVASTLNGYLTKPMLEVGTAEDEARLWEIATTCDNTSLSRRLKMTLTHVMRSEEVCAVMYDMWLSKSDKMLNESDYMTLAYELAVRYPERYDEIYTTQLERISNADRRNQFEYIMRGTHPDSDVRDALFESLMEPENRRIEPWTATLLGYLNHHLRQEEAVKYIYRGLEEIEEVQRTGDIFFPRNWAGALLGGHTSDAAKAEVERFLSDHPELNQLLRNKILQAADMRLR
ncbi:MAG: aminopeptidase [Alistipes sp.]|nr:aminopeptidase [Alistipes sp.]